MTTAGAESSSDNADAQVQLGWFPLDGQSHEHGDDVECLDTDTESRDSCTTDSQPIDSQRIDSHSQHNMFSAPVPVVGRQVKRQAKESLSLLCKVYDENVYWWKRLFKLPTGSAGKRFVDSGFYSRSTLLVFT